MLCIVTADFQDKSLSGHRDFRSRLRNVSACPFALLYNCRMCDDERGVKRDGRGCKNEYFWGPVSPVTAEIGKKCFLCCVIRPHAQRRVTQPRKSILAELCCSRRNFRKKVSQPLIQILLFTCRLFNVRHPRRRRLSPEQREQQRQQQQEVLLNLGPSRRHLRRRRREGDPVTPGHVGAAPRDRLPDAVQLRVALRRLRQHHVRPVTRQGHRLCLRKWQQLLF